MRFPFNKLAHGTKLAAGNTPQLQMLRKLSAAGRSAPMPSRMRRAGTWAGGHKKIVAGAGAIGLGVSAVRNNSGRPADRPNGRPTGPYMY